MQGLVIAHCLIWWLCVCLCLCVCVWVRACCAGTAIKALKHPFICGTRICAVRQIAALRTRMEKQQLLNLFILQHKDINTIFRR